MLISKQQRDKNKTCFVEGWDVTPKQNAEWQIHNKMMDNSAPFLDQLFWPCLCFAEQLWSLVILMMFWWQNDRWHHLSQTQLDSWNSCICPTKMAQEPTMIFTSHLNYATVVACNLSKWVQQVWNLTDAGRQTWVADECQSWQRHLRSWCYGKTWLGKMTEVSQLRVIFWFNSHHCYGIHGRSFNLSSLDS
jgi:hypothetical protein